MRETSVSEGLLDQENRGTVRLVGPAGPPLAHVEAAKLRWHADRSRRDRTFRRLLGLADVAAAAGTLAAVGAFGHPDLLPFAIIASLAVVPLSKIMGRYDREASVLRKSTLEEFPSLVMLSAGFALIWSLLLTVLGRSAHQDHAGVVWLFATVLIVLARSAARSLARASAPTERVLIIGSPDARTRLANSLASDPGARLEVVGFLPFEEPGDLPAGQVWAPPTAPETMPEQATYADFDTVVKQLDVERMILIPTSADNAMMLDAVSRANRLDVKVSIVPSLLEVVGSAVEFDTVGGATLLGLRQPGLTRSSRMLKRSMDLAGAALGLLLVSPLLAVLALAVKLDSRGPVFFRQQRVGREGNTFWMVKFRSMVAGAEAQRSALQALNETDGVFKLSTDPRVTRIGRLLRRTSLDELPQLFNVLRGDMSLVGPRPLVLEEDRLIEGHHRSRLTLAPGMTGPWQVLGPARPPLSEMVKTDYLYAANWNLWTDVKILLRTVAHVSARRNK